MTYLAPRPNLILLGDRIEHLRLAPIDFLVCCIAFVVLVPFLEKRHPQNDG